VSRSSIARVLAICRGHRATLPIAKLGRLARNVHFISGLMETGVPFVATASPFMLHVYAAMAAAEGIAISTRFPRRLGFQFIFEDTKLDGAPAVINPSTPVSELCRRR
jgi:hypothetical protein